MRSLLFLLALVALFAGCTHGSDDGAADTTATTTPTAVPAPADETETETAAADEPAASEEPQFAKADLPQIALQPRDAPEGWTYVEAESGPRTLDEAGIVLDEQLAQVRNYGLVGIRDAVFDSKQPELRLSSRVWLFARPRGAARWLEKTRQDLTLFQFDQIDAPQLADGSWAARGEADGNRLISHAFRLSNAVIVVTLSSQKVEPREADALAAAERALARARSA